MPEDPIAQSEVAALTRRMEEMEGRLTALTQTQGIQLAMTLGERLAAQEGRINARLDDLKEHVDTRNTKIIELLSNLVGKDLNAQ